MPEWCGAVGDLRHRKPQVSQVLGYTAQLGCVGSSKEAEVPSTAGRLGEQQQGGCFVQQHSTWEHGVAGEVQWEDILHAVQVGIPGHGVQPH